MEWCRLSIIDDARSLPDMSVVDQIARLALMVRRAGGRLVLEAMCDELSELFELAGLGVEMQWEAERREEPLRIEGGQEDRQLGDLPS